MEKNDNARRGGMIAKLSPRNREEGIWYPKGNVNLGKSKNTVYVLEKNNF